MSKHEFKEGKSYRITVYHKFEGEFQGVVEENGEPWAIFKTGGSGRYGEYTRKVPISNMISSELVK